MAKAAPITAANVDDAGPSAVREHHLHSLWAARTVPPLLPPWMEGLSQVSKTAVCGIVTFLFSAWGSQDLFISCRHDSVMHGGAAVMRDFEPICDKKHKAVLRKLDGSE